MSAIVDRLETLQAKVERLQEEMRALAAMEHQDYFEDGAIIRCVASFDGKLYTYAILKIKNLWYLTGRTERGMPWDELIVWLTSGKTVETFEYIYPRELTVIVEMNRDYKIGNYTFKRGTDGVYR